MAARHDYSAIPPLGSYAAKLCPVRVQLDVLQPGEPAPLPADAQLRINQGVAFEEGIVAQLVATAGADWVFVDEARLCGDERRAATTSAIAARAPVIVGANLDPDIRDKRAGKPDLLVWHEDGYVPVDIKHHMALDARDTGPAALISELADPAPAGATADPVWQRRRHKGDALQLAHYRRMLEAAELAAGEPMGGIVGKEGRVVWYRLDEPLWQTPAKSDGKKRKLRTTLEAYDFEFDFRRDISAVAHRRLEDSSVALIVEPMFCSDCALCPWREICEPELLAGAGDASLLPGLAYRQWRRLRDVGVVDRDQVARLDLQTAELLAAKVEAARWLDAAAGVAPQTPLGDLRPGAKKQLEALRAVGLTTAGDIVDHVDAPTAQLNGWAANAIVHARAATGPAPVYRLPGADAAVPRADIEIDVDMENTNDGVYQWGVCVTDRAGTGLVSEGYRAFITWEPIDPDGELRTFTEFWNWLTDIRHRAAAAGYTVKAYCWHENAENTQMRRISAPGARLAAEVREFIHSDEWIDLLQVFRGGWTTGGSTSLKRIAPLAGFEWEVEDPGGGVSMRYHALATDPMADKHHEAREWLLTYNRGDVEATRAIRDWLATSNAPVLPAPDRG